ncbi:uncharacterized protein [Argopecten irradians]|uniref:uncharacterized protein n=1 Tax=Argopecten irradians TaxID=31199 RepID=UPI003722EA1A
MSTPRTRYYCAAEGCFSDNKKLGKYGYMSDVKFYPFPTRKKDPKGRRRWLELLRRQDYDPPPYHRICSRHFVDGLPTAENPYPTLFSYNNYKQARNTRLSAASMKRQVNRSREELIDVGGQDDAETETECSSLPDPHIMDEHTSVFMAVAREEIVVDCDRNDAGFVRVSVPLDHDYVDSNGSISNPEQCDNWTQTSLTMKDLEQLEGLQQKFEDPDKLMRDLFIEKVTKDDQSIRKYTGIPTERMLEGFFNILDSASPTLKYWSGQKSSADSSYQMNPDLKKSGPQRKLTRYEEFILTLVRLRLAVFTFFLADIFGISSSRVSQIFATWINFMYCIVSPLLKWPSSKTVKMFMPNSFKISYPDTVCIIDCTEFFIAKPQSPTAQSQTYSSYKHHNTYKALVAITPSGAFSFVSSLWGGNTSDRYITRASGFLDNIRPGDEVMADRGFLIRDLLLERQAKLVIPPFTKKCKWGKGKRLNSSDVVKTRNIARLRIHVERAIGRLKTFHILSNTMPLSLKPLANQMLKVCAFMCNLQKPLVKK